jgi:hypothetical protein
MVPFPFADAKAYSSAPTTVKTEQVPLPPCGRVYNSNFSKLGFKFTESGSKFLFVDTSILHFFISRGDTRNNTEKKRIP